MSNYLYETRLLGKIVFIKTNIRSKTMNITTMIPAGVSHQTSSLRSKLKLENTYIVHIHEPLGW